MGELIPAAKTKLTEAEATYALREGWKLVFGEYPSIDSLSILWAQSALETGRWTFIWNYNFGNIKRHDDHDYCMFRCNEVIGGKVVWFDPPDPQTWFCAYPSAVDGAREYIEFVSQRSRYKLAWAQLVAGSAIKYCAALKTAGYFTADLVSYTKGVVSLCEEFKRKAPTLLDYTPPAPPEPAPEPTPEPTPEPVPAPEPTPTPQPVEPSGFSFQSILDLLSKLFSLFKK